MFERNGGWGRNRTGVHGFAGRCITTLPPSPKGSQIKKGKAGLFVIGFPLCETGAGNETRTRDPNLGKVVLYQLSYSRNISKYCKQGRWGVNPRPQLYVLDANYKEHKIRLPATMEAKCLREANPYACFRSGASIPAKRILCC